MSKEKRIFVLLIAAIGLLVAALYAWNPAARKPQTMAELVGIHADFEQAYVTEIIGTSTINSYNINTDTESSMLSMKTFLKETEIEYVGRADKILTFEGNTSFNVYFIDADHHCEVRLDSTGSHIYFGGIEYKVKDQNDMANFLISLPGTIDTAANRMKAYAEQLTEASMEYLEVLKGRPAVIIGEYIEPVEKEYFDLLYAGNQAVNNGVTKDEIFEKIKRFQIIKQQAAAYGLEPTDEEVAAEVANQQTLVSSDAETKMLRDLYIETLGISQKDYWEFLYPAQIRLLLRNNKVEAYIKENNLQTIDEIMEGMNMEVVVYDERY